MAVVVSINPNNHDAGVAIVRDGKLVAAALEERFTRQKHHATLPSFSLQYCLQAAGVSLDEVDAFAYPFSDKLLARFGRRTVLSAIGQGARDPFRAFAEAYVDLRWSSRRSTRGIIGHYYDRTVEQAGIARGIDRSKLRFVPHHDAHAAGAYYVSGMEEAAVLVVDGRGELTSTTYARGDRAGISTLAAEPVRNSLGFYYSAVTKHLGWEANEGEGKTMGLAPYGKPGVPIERLLDVRTDSWRVEPATTRLSRDRAGVVEEKLGVARRTGGSALEGPYPDVAFAAQDALERAMVVAARKAMDLAGSKQLTLTGGVALNCKANLRLKEEAKPERLYVVAPAGDGGVTVGAALAVAKEMGDDVRQDIQRDDWGPSFDDAQIEKILVERRVRYTRPADLGSEVAGRLARGEIIAWFQGRMELGPRSLGHRAILADPREEATRDRVNLLKGREAWRPLCPSMLAERAGDLLVDADDAPFMIVSYRVKPEARKLLGAAVHVDGTTRPQTVRREVSPSYHHLLTRFERETGVPALLNTSFNPAGYPIACTPTHALADFYSMGLDALAIGPFLVTR